MKSFNPIITGYPSHIEVDGKKIEVRTGFRYWLQITRCLDDGDIPYQEKLRTVGRLSGVPIEDEATLDALLDFLSADAKGKPKRQSERSFDWDWDAELVVSSFEMQYGIDITSPDTDLHWWRFMALFRGLGDDTPIMRTISTRTMEEPRGNDEATRERRKRIREAKKQLRIPPKSKQEYLERERALWGE